MGLYPSFYFEAITGPPVSSEGMFYGGMIVKLDKKTFLWYNTRRKRNEGLYCGVAALIALAFNNN